MKEWCCALNRNRASIVPPSYLVMFPQYQSCSSIGLLSKLFLAAKAGLGLEWGLVKDWVVTYTGSPGGLREREREKERAKVYLKEALLAGRKLSESLLFH